MASFDANDRRSETEQPLTPRDPHSSQETISPAAYLSQSMRRSDENDEFISSDYPFTGQELRDILSHVLHIRCSYPLFPSHCYGSTIRCILELNEELDHQISHLRKFEGVVVIEDVICKVMPKFSSQRIVDEKKLLFSFPLKKPSVMIFLSSYLSESSLDS